MKQQQRNRRGETLFPGIARHAETLGCNRSHLHLVLKGDRQSPRLIKLYKELLKKEGRDIPSSLLRRTA